MRIAGGAGWSGAATDCATDEWNETVVSAKPRRGTATNFVINILDV
jgi:hypothetical protein